MTSHLDGLSAEKFRAAGTPLQAVAKVPTLTLRGSAAGERASTDAAPTSPTDTAVQENLFWQSVMNSTDSVDREGYLRQFRNGVYRPSAQNWLARRWSTGVVCRSDQGRQYTSLAFGARCRESDVAPSTGSAGDCYDHAMAESFFATLECELLDCTRLSAHAAARAAMFECIEGWYNPRRHHSALAIYRRSISNVSTRALWTVPGLWTPCRRQQARGIPRCVRPRHWPQGTMSMYRS